MQRGRIYTLPSAWLGLGLFLAANTVLAQPDTPEWLERSNEIAYKVLEMNAHFSPEFAAQQGIDGFDEEIFDFGPYRYEREQAVNQERIEYLEEMLAVERDPRVQQHIQIMIGAVRDDVESNRVNYERLLPYFDLTGALYAESIAKPYMPLDGQLFSLQARLLRAARIWLDPMLNLNLIKAEEAKRILMEYVMEDELSAQNEIDRYTFQIPGQATAYYYGYENLQALRAQTELKLKDRFDQKAYHDFLLAQGLLPPEVLADSVEKGFIAPQVSL